MFCPYLDYDGVTADNITDGENATEMEYAESDVDSDIDDHSDPDYNPDDSFHEFEEEGDSGDEWEAKHANHYTTDAVYNKMRK